MAIHVIEQEAFFAASIPLGDQQRALILPENRPVAPGDELYLRNVAGEINWVADVLDVRQMAGPAALAGVSDPPAQTYLIVGYLARIHPGTLPRGRANLKAPWVTLNSRTLPNALPWRPGGVLVYHHTMHLVDTVLTEQQLEVALAEGCVVMHRTQHYVTVTGDGRKRLLVTVFGVPLACSLCGSALPSLDDATLDHRIPTSQGGPDVLANLQLAHKRCNELKGNALPEQYPPLFTPPSEWPAGVRRNGRTRKRTVASRPVIVTGSEAEVAAAKPSEADAQASAAQAKLSPSEAKSSASAAKPSQQAEAKPKQAASRKTASKATKAKKTAQAAANAAAQPAVAADVKASAEAAAQTAAAKETAAKGKPTTKRSAKKSATKAASEPAAAAPPAEVAAAAGAEDTAALSAARKQGAPSGSAPSADAANEDPNDAAWLETVTTSGWHALVKLAGSPDWAARTAALRTMVQVRRSQVEPARQDGRLLAEQSGPAGRYALLDWKGMAVLCEESDEGTHMFHVPMLHSLTPEVYVWHLSQFGRRTPLQVAMHLRPYWSSGQPDDSGRVQARKDERMLVLGVSGDRLVECHWLDSDPQVA